jgi:chromosome segregation ATPase
MSALPVATALETDVESPETTNSAESPEPARHEHAPETSSANDGGDVRLQVLGLQKKLEETAVEFGRLRTNIASQQQLQDLLKQGRVHLQDLRSRLQQTTADRDRLEAELSDHKTAHQREVDRLQAQLDDLADQFQKAAAGRDRLTAQLEEQEAMYKQFREERTEERASFERLLAEATSNQRDMVQELDEKRQQIETLREAAMRSQQLARQIMRAHEENAAANDKS